MTTLALPVRLINVDTTHSQSVSMARLVQVETRKFVDTRAGATLLIVAAALALVLGGIGAYYYKAIYAGLPADWFGIAVLMVAPFNLLMPAVAALLVTTEWSQRSALTTFTLEPRRGRVIAAKAITMAVIAVAITTVLLASSAIFSIIGASRAGMTMHWGLDRALLIPLMTLLVSMVIGFGLGLMLMNTPAAIVTVVALPTISGILAGFGAKGQAILDWGSPLVTLSNVLSSDPTGKQWLQFAVAMTIWIVIPITVGVIRHLRTEVK